MRIAWKRWMAGGVLAAFCFASLPALGFAGPRHSERGEHRDRYEQERRRPRHDKRHDRFVINHMHIRDHHFKFARGSRLTLRDLLFAKEIAKRSALDVEDVLRMHVRGRSYRSVAKQHHVVWNTVERDVERAYDDMYRDAVKRGIALWAIDELLD